MNENTIPFWKLIKDLSVGAYVCGDTFINQRDEMIYVDIKGNLVLAGHYIYASDEWQYVGDAE